MTKSDYNSVIIIPKSSRNGKVIKIIFSIVNMLSSGDIICFLSFRSAMLQLALVSVIKPSTHHSSEQYPVMTTRAEPWHSWSSTLGGLGLELLEQMMIMVIMAWPHS